ncbi:MAG: hypothetical protein LBN95_09325 [Prevotellaceae bacterium]|jgi:hypothetical protein|nr:hypothetical protein [Prevotellaceae bacterium]
MNKELLITLINKDIEELKLLTRGFDVLENIPETMIDLSVAKAQSIVDCLQNLTLCAVVENKEQETKNKDGEKKIEINRYHSSENGNISNQPAQQEIPAFEEMAEEKVEEISVEEEIIVEPEIEEKIEIVEVEKKPETVKPKKEEQQQMVFETQLKQETLIDTFVKDNNIVANTIPKNKISDLRNVFSIADRFRFQREIFDGNGENFAQALADFNQMTEMSEANAYIAKNLKWDLENPIIQEFLKILERKLN